MRIGILTFCFSKDNYGQILQCYALQKYLRNLGHDAFLINYNYQNDIKPLPFVLRCFKALNPVKFFRYIKNKMQRKIAAHEQKLHDRHFDDFCARYIVASPEYKSYPDLKQKPPKADAYIVGSDQVWNFGAVKLPRVLNRLHANFLDFGDGHEKRLSYAASWSVRSLPQDFMQEIKPLLARFDYIGVREESGVELCRLCGRGDAEWAADPTLLLDAGNYRRLYLENAVRKPKGKYILLFMLSNICKFDVRSVYDFAKARSLEVVYVTGNNRIDFRQKYFATVPEWLYLVDNAEYVVTNSYHCGVFSTIFKKRFGIVPLCGIYEGMNARFESLFALRGTGMRFVSDRDFSVLDQGYTVNEVVPPQKFLNALQ